MSSFREDAEPYIVLKCAYDNLLGLDVLEHISESVPLAYHREYAEIEHELCDKFVVEHVCTCSENNRTIVCTQCDDGVHQRVAMVWCKDYRTVCRQVFLTLHFDFPVAVSDAPVNNVSENVVSQILIVYVLSCHFMLFFCSFLSSTYLPEVGECQTGNNVPNTPACGNHQHASVVCPCTCVREYVRVEKEDKA